MEAIRNAEIQTNVIGINEEAVYILSTYLCLFPLELSSLIPWVEKTLSKDSRNDSYNYTRQLMFSLRLQKEDDLPFRKISQACVVFSLPNLDRAF